MAGLEGRSQGPPEWAAVVAQEGIGLVLSQFFLLYLVFLMLLIFHILPDLQVFIFLSKWSCRMLHPEVLEKTRNDNTLTPKGETGVPLPMKEQCSCIFIMSSL